MPSSVLRKLLFLWVTLLLSHRPFAQGRSSFRKLLNRVHINASVGYGNSWYAYQVVQTSEALSTEAVVFKEGDRFYINTGEPGVVYLIRWFDGSHVRMNSYTSLRDIPNHQKIIAHAKFKGKGKTTPISLSSHVDLWGKMRVGLGGAFFINILESLAHEEESKDKNLGAYVPLQKKHYHVRPFAILGFKFIDNSIVSVLLDTNFGFDFIYVSSDAKWKCMGGLNLGVQSIGITIEKNISAYVRLFGRLSYEISSPQDALNDTDTAIVLARESVLLQLGFSFSYPEIPRCSLPGCEVERKHKHNGEVYRGVSIFTSRDAQGRRLYKK
jgi:hypothetical protein